MIKIYKNIPIPGKINRSKEYRELINKLEIGHSAIIEDHEQLGFLRCVLSDLRRNKKVSSTYQITAKKQLDCSFRVWRIK